MSVIYEKDEEDNESVGERPPDIKTVDVPNL